MSKTEHLSDGTCEDDNILNDFFQNKPIAEITDEEFDETLRRQRKLLTRQIELKKISPLTYNQENAFNIFYDGNNILMNGCAGTGKTYLALYFALGELRSGRVKKIILSRSAVTTRDMGFLPGTLEEKMSQYEFPYKDIVYDLTGNAGIYDILKKKGYISFMSTSYIRGLNINDSIVIFDEAQNCTFHEIGSLLTRLGENSRIFVCGDTNQDDLQQHRRQTSGFSDLLAVAREMKSFGIVTFTIEDIVRSGFVREFLETKMKLGIV